MTPTSCSTKITEPGGREWTFEHDAGGNLTQIDDPDGNTTSYTYDGHSHLTEQTAGPLGEDGSGEIDDTYTYDSGLLTEVDDGGGSTYQITSAAAQGLDAAIIIRIRTICYRVRPCHEHCSPLGWAHCICFAGKQEGAVSLPSNEPGCSLLTK